MRGLWLVVLVLGCDDGGSAPANVGGRDAAEARVCRLNSDCPPGLYCKDRLCEFDCRVSRDCPTGQTCESGQCLSPACARDDECNPPATICEDLQCIPGCATSGCPADQACGAPSGRCAVPDCRRDGCPNGGACDANGVCQAVCAPACPEGQRCDDGTCVVAGCRDDGCPNGQICDPDTGLCQPPDFDCRQDGCPQTLQCDVQTGQCERPLFDCRRDSCRLPEVCDTDTGQCVVPDPPDCRRTGCPVDQNCNQNNGMCEERVVVQPVGGPCNRAHDCESNVCLGAQVPGFCSKVCCAETDCPQGMGCLYQGGVSLCIPRGLVANNDFSAGAGSACGAGFNNCRTGLCLQGRCAAMCCTDRDCPTACVWTPTADGSARAICDIPNLLGDGPGAPCYSDLDCDNRVCIADPDAGPGDPPGLCVGWCCGNADCGPGFGCGQVQAPGHVITACTPLVPGPVADGAGCLLDADCRSGHCIENVCRQPCCRDQDQRSACLVGERCLPRTTAEGNFIRVCVPPDP